MATRAWTLAVLLATAACSPVGDRNGDGRLLVACIGDSNTFSVGGVSWCEPLRAAMRRRWSSADAITAGSFGGHYAVTHEVRDGMSLDAPVQVARLLGRARPDVAVLAFGSNDVRLGFPAADTAGRAVALRDELAAHDVLTFVALVPPFGAPAADAHPEWNAEVAALNQALRVRLPADALIDWTIFPDADYETDGARTRDGVHFNAQGQARRAAAVWRVLGWPWA